MVNRVLLFEVIQILGEAIAYFFAPSLFGHAFGDTGYRSGPAVA